VRARHGAYWGENRRREAREMAVAAVTEVSDGEGDETDAAMGDDGDDEDEGGVVLLLLVLLLDAGV
jgi:hypothetical protein